MKSLRLPHQGFSPIGRDRLLREKVHDSYKLRGKLKEPTVCSECGAVYHQGSWRWLPRPEAAVETICPACHRLRDHYPAGYVTLHGDRLNVLQDELLHLIRNEEQREKADHALQRIMDIEKGEGEWLVTTTDIHLARRIGEALHQAYQGALEYHYNPEENLLRVHWAA
ncbi:MAG TPA: BCAM0308 family protein [Azospira sp.]|nr:BCAM0308 family protein [Azospira sp.]